MKKTIALILVLLSLASVSFAESSVDLVTLTTEELIELRTAINAELAARDFKEKEVTVPPGRYTVGADIPAGVYTLIRTEKYSSAVTTYTQTGQYDLSFGVSIDNPVGKIELSEGQTVEILHESVVFKPYAGLGF